MGAACGTKGSEERYVQQDREFLYQLSDCQLLKKRFVTHRLDLVPL